MRYDLLFILIFVLVNLLGFFAQYADKQRAIKNKWRTPEYKLWRIGLIAATGSYLGMRVFHHKTKHKRFMIGMPILSIIQIAILIFLILLTRNWEGF